MKKWLGKLLVLTLGITALTGCDLFSLGDANKKGDEEYAVDHLEVKDYTETAVQNSKYNFDGKVYLSYEDSSVEEKEVTEYCTFTSLDTSKTGDQTFKVSYEGSKFVYSKKVHVNVVGLASLEFKDLTSYVKLNSTYTFSGKVVAKFTNDAEQDVTSKVTVDDSKVNTSKEGTYEIKTSYTYGGVTKTATANILVSDAKPELKSISVSGQKTTIEKNTKYSFEGATITATYEGGVNETINPEDCDFNPQNLTFTSKGAQLLTISYTAECLVNGNVKNITKSTSFTVTVTSTLKSFTAEDVEVGEGRSRSISVTYNPTDADNKSLTYHSNDETVATVDSNGAVRGVAQGHTTITISSSIEGVSPVTINVTVNEASSDKWTILVYMCGANLESDSSQGGAATEDLQEIASVSGQPDDVNVVVQAGGANRWESTYSSVIKTTTRNRIHLKNKTYVRDDSTDQAKENMGSESTLKSFVKWGLETYPADKIGLIFWNHGGAMSGCCGDEQFSNDYLMNDEIVRAIRAAKSESGYSNKFEFIGYDCCLMQIQDIAGTNSEFAKYMVASEASEWGYGWSYEKWIDDVFADRSTEQILSEVVDGFAETTTQAYKEWSEYYHETYENDQTLSYMNLSYWEAYQTAWDSMISAININSSSAWSTFANVVSGSFTFERGSFDNFDVGNFITKMKSSSSYKNNSTVMSRVSELETAYGNLVAKTWHGDAYTDAQVTGLCLFCPINRSISKNTYNETATPFGAYRTACINYGTWSNR